jgi:hypothetical protein
MKPVQMLQIDGVFLAVKCTHCGTVYDAGDGDYLAFYGSVTSGLSSVLLGVSPPRRPAKKAIQVVCRTPTCVGELVKKMMGCDAEDDGNGRWSNILKAWADESGHAFADDEEDDLPLRLDPKAKLRAKRRA